MASSLSTNDNNCGVLFSQLNTNSGLRPDIVDYQDLIKIANTTIKELTSNNSSLLVFPEVLGAFDDGIEEQHVFDLYGNPEQLEKVVLTTGNLMGFIGIGNTQLKITSRFSKDDSQDHFMHYMLQKVFSINLFDYKYTSGSNGELDLLMFAFPMLLKKALAQGLYKQYQTFERNDANVKGIINVNRHIKQNIPFGGSVAYTSRERTFDNSITELIRHTIEYIKTNPLGSEVLNCDIETKNCIREIVAATESYNLRNRDAIIGKNINPINHPYYTAYKPLQKLCLSILRHKKIGFGNSRNKVYGILFDGAWLWEEYLATTLKSCGFIHPRNKAGTGAINVYRGNPRYPDFYMGKQIKNGALEQNITANFVLDAKYKHLDNHKPDTDEITGYFSRDDLHQLITYMYIMPAKSAGLIYPYDKNDSKTQAGKIVVTVDRQIYGYEGKIRTYGVPIPVKENYSDFVDYMSSIENEISIFKWNT